MTRRRFLTRVGSAGLAAVAGWAPDALGAGAQPRRKLVLVQFGGGTRYSESVGDPHHRFIPRLWNELVPRGALFTDLRVEGKAVHPNSTGSMMTGHWEWADLDWTRPVAHPTLLEIHRQASGGTDLGEWLFVYASILAKAGESRAGSGGGATSGLAPNVVIPPTIPRSTQEAMDHLMQAAAATGNMAAGDTAARECARLARQTSRLDLSGLRSDAARQFVQQQYERWKSGAGSTSHDLFLTEAAIACLKAHTPDILAVCFGEIDCAHYGNWSRYVEAIRRTDVLTWRLWQTIQSLPAYRDQTLMLILPDHGRELEESGGLGYVHHSDFYTGAGADEGCRQVWMLALGPGVAAGRSIGRTTPITTVAATGLEFLGLGASPGAAESIWRMLP
jgi:hypothetical protein